MIASTAGSGCLGCVGSPCLYLQREANPKVVYEWAQDVLKFTEGNQTRSSAQCEWSETGGVIGNVEQHGLR